MTIWCGPRDRTCGAGRLLLVTFCVLAVTAGYSGNAIGKQSASLPGLPLARSEVPLAGRPVPAAVSAINGFTVSRLPQSEMNRQLAAMYAHGVQVVRSDAVWADIEPDRPGPAGPAWQFSQVDAWVSALATHHLTWEPLIDFSVWWAKTCPGFCAPTGNSTYATFARAIAARYGAGGSFWSAHPKLPYYPARTFEIWDEENVRTFWVAPARFATLYLAARGAMRSVDPGASVIIGGLADDSSSFNPAQDYPAWYVGQMLVADPALRGNVDGFGLHPYGATATDDEAWVADFRRKLDLLGEGAAPIYITELGWTTGDAARERWRAGMMFDVASTLARSTCGIAMLAPYDWINPAILRGPGDFGLVDRSGGDTDLRPAGTEWFHGLALAAAKPAPALCDAASARG